MTGARDRLARRARPGRRGATGMSGDLAGRLARAAVAFAARRWPVEIAGILHEEWQAELHALRTAGRPWRMLWFAVSLAVSPAVDEPAWGERLARAGRVATVAAGATVLAAALSNGVHALGDGLLPVAATGMAACGLRARIGSAAVIPLLGMAMFAFLMAGNEVAVMPFMGVADIAPAVVTWTALMLVVARLCRMVRGRRRALVATAGGLLTMGAATIAGSWHAAGALGVGLERAPAWLPLTLLPGGTARFGPVLPSGAYASEVLLGNAAAMTVPLLLVTVFALATGPATATGHPAPPAGPATATGHPAPPAGPATASGHSAPPAGPATASGHLAPPAGPATATDRAAAPWAGIAAGVVAALAGWGCCELMRLSTGPVETTLHRMVDGSAVFGFGFAAHPAGQALVALLVALLAVRIVENRSPVRG